MPNPTGNHSELTVMRFDANNDGVIDYNPWDGNGSQASYNESLWDWVERGTLSDGVLGPHIGTRAVGFRYSLDSNPVIIPHQAYDQLNEKLSQIPLNGLSVEIVYYDAASGDLKIRVRYDDTQISRNTRWTGDLKTYPVRGATNGSEIYVYNGVTLTLDRSGTAQRQHPGPRADFVSDTRLTVSSGTRLTVWSRRMVRRCMVPASHGVDLSSLFRANLWTKYFTAAPVQRRPYATPSRPAPTAWPNSPPATA